MCFEMAVGYVRLFYTRPKDDLTQCGRVLACILMFETSKLSQALSVLLTLPTVGDGPLTLGVYACTSERSFVRAYVRDYSEEEEKRDKREMKREVEHRFVFGSRKKGQCFRYSNKLKISSIDRLFPSIMWRTLRIQTPPPVTLVSSK